MNRKHWMVLAGPVVLGLIAVAAPADVISFQNGVDGYAGAEDNMLARVGTSDGLNYGANVYTGVGNPRFGNKPNDMRTIWRWDTSALASQYVAINSVTIEINSLGANMRDGRFPSATADIFAVSPANSAWVAGTEAGQQANAGESCYAYLAYDPSTPTSWAGSAGLGTAGTDYDPVSLSSHTWSEGNPSGGTTLTFSLTPHAGLTLKDLVDQWSGDQANNAGVVIIGPDLTEANNKSFSQFSSNQDVTPSLRPKLTIEYSAGVRVGDANLDGVVDDRDLSLLLANWGQDVTGEPDGGWGKGEFNGIAPVQDADLSLLLANWTGTGAAVPEPATLMLLGVGGAALIRRRSRG